MQRNWARELGRGDEEGTMGGRVGGGEEGAILKLDC